MMTEFPTTKAEFERQWISCASKLTGIELVHLKLVEAAASYFTLKQDDTARAFRDCADRISQDFLEPERRRLRALALVNKLSGREVTQ